MLGPQLQIDRNADRTRVTWYRLSVIEIMLAFVLLIGVVWGIGSAAGAEEILGLRILQMTTFATLIYWTITAVLTVHLLFNRKSQLHIDASGLTLRKRPFPPIVRHFPRNEIREITSKRAEKYHESASAAPEGDTYNIFLWTKAGKRTRIGNFGEADAEKMMKLLPVVTD